MTNSIYYPITGKRRMLHLFTQLFLGPDHLLLVRSNRFEERYQRFYFKDIQALVVTGLPARTWMQTGLGVLSAAIILLDVTTIRVAGWRVLVGMIALIPALIAVVDYFRGERCGMIVKTAVSNEPLPPVSRMSTARSVIFRMRTTIELAQQGGWTPEMQPVSGSPVMAMKLPGLAPANRLLPALFGLVTLDAVIYVAARLTRRNEILAALVYSVFTEIVLAIVTLRRRGGDPRWLLYAFSGVIAVCSSLDILFGMGLFGFFAYITSEDQRTGATNSTRFFQLAYPQAMMWWGFSWRIVLAAAAWIAYVWTPKPGAAVINPPEGGPPSPQ
jgi:hypothetical protein